MALHYLVKPNRSDLSLTDFNEALFGQIEIRNIVEMLSIRFNHLNLRNAVANRHFPVLDNPGVDAAKPQAFALAGVDK